MKYRFAKAKLFIETCSIFPIVLVGRIFGIIKPLKGKFDVFLFISNADTGGAAVCNIDILEAIKGHRPLVIFSKIPKNNKLIEGFQKEFITSIDLSARIDKKYLHFVNIFYRGVIASWIAQQKPRVVFGGETIFFYKVIPFIPKSILKIELCHLNTWLGYSIGFVDLIDKRVFSTAFLRREVTNQYAQNRLGEAYSSKLFFIDNAYEMPTLVETKSEILQLYFIGRGVAQKRVHLIAEAAKRMREKNRPVQFNFVGNVENIIAIDKFPYCMFHGVIGDKEELQHIYESADVLVLTSKYEGLPMVVIAMMSNGKAIISTAVNAIPDYITHFENGLLIHETEEEKIVEQLIEQIEYLLSTPEKLTEMGLNNRKIAEKLFSYSLFKEKYLELFELA